MTVTLSSQVLGRESEKGSVKEPPALSVCHMQSWLSEVSGTEHHSIISGSKQQPLFQGSHTWRDIAHIFSLNHKQNYPKLESLALYTSMRKPEAWGYAVPSSKSSVPTFEIIKQKQTKQVEMEDKNIP